MYCCVNLYNPEQGDQIIYDYKNKQKINQINYILLTCLQQIHEMCNKVNLKVISPFSGVDTSSGSEQRQTKQKNTTQITKKMSNTDLTKNQW